MVHEDSARSRAVLLRTWLVRLTVLSIWLVVVANTPYKLYAFLPTTMMAGMGIGRFLTASPEISIILHNPFALQVLKWTAIMSAGLLMCWPWRCRYLMPLLAIAVLILDSLTKSLNGYANHAQIAPLLLLVIIAGFANTRFPSPVGRVGLEVSPTSAHHAILWLARLAIVIPYTFIGLNRLFVGGTAIFANDTIIEYVMFSSERYSYYGFDVIRHWLIAPGAALALKIGFVTTTVFEISSLGVMFSRRFRAVWLVVMVGFHLSTLITMSIFFWENLLLLIALFGPWPVGEPIAAGGRRVGDRLRMALSP